MYEHDWYSAGDESPHRYLRAHSYEALAGELAGYADVCRIESRESGAEVSTWGSFTVNVYINADEMSLTDAERLLTALTAATAHARQMAATSNGGQ
jgi:hypothetical protein